MSCRNCNDDQKKGEDISLPNVILYFDCTRLSETKYLFYSSSRFDTIRRSSWQAGDRIEARILPQHLFPSNPSSGRSSRRGSADLPVISEPTTGEAVDSEKEDDDEDKVQQSVQNAVERLLRYK